MRTECRSVLQQEKAARAKPSVEKWCVYGFSGSALIQELITADVITAVMLTLISAGLREKMMLLPMWKYHQIMFITHSQSSRWTRSQILVSAHKPKLACPEPPKLFASADKVRSLISSLWHEQVSERPLKHFAGNVLFLGTLILKASFCVSAQNEKSCFTQPDLNLSWAVQTHNCICFRHVQLFRSFFFSPPEPKRVPHHAWMRKSTCCVCTRVQMIRHEDGLRLWAHHLFQPQFSKPINQSLIQDDTRMQIIFCPESTNTIMSCASACFQSSTCADAPPFAGNMSNKFNNCTADTVSGSQTWMRVWKEKKKHNTYTNRNRNRAAGQGG